MQAQPCAKWLHASLQRAFVEFNAHAG